MQSFQVRLNEKLGPKGYEPGMRRSVQSAIMFEAQRCVQDKLDKMRPFQRKIAFFDQLVAILESLDFIPPHYRAEVMWRTATSKEAMTPEIAWKRSRLIERELTKLAEKIKPWMQTGNSHEEACEAMLQEMFESVSKEQAKEQANGDDDDEEKITEKSKERPAHWEHAHNNVFMTFKMYYRGAELDPDLPPPAPTIPIVVPTQRPTASGDTGHFIYPNGGPNSTATGMPGPNLNNMGAQMLDHDTDDGAGMVSAGKAGKAQHRQNLLKEVRDHLDILRSFEGIIPAEEVNRRKRELFLALPPAPPPQSDNKRNKPTIA